MTTCVVCGKPALYYDFHLRGMACAAHASAEVQVAAVRSLTAALLKAIAGEPSLDEHSEVAQIIRQLRPLLKD
jgi:recombinational DNA repair protein (RecF pathway)